MSCVVNSSRPFAFGARLVAAGLLSGTLVGCGSSDLTCAAVIRPGEPIVQLTVKDQTTGQTAASVVLSNITIDGAAADVSSLVASSIPGVSATAVGNTLTCAGTCSFGQIEGSYSFTVTAGSRPSAGVILNAKYSGRSKKGCDDRWTGGTKLTVTL
jgi:hypothetical protein